MRQSKKIAFALIYTILFSNCIHSQSYITSSDCDKIVLGLNSKFKEMAENNKIKTAEDYGNLVIVPVVVSYLIENYKFNGDNNKINEAINEAISCISSRLSSISQHENSNIDVDAALAFFQRFSNNSSNSNSNTNSNKSSISNENDCYDCKGTGQCRKCNVVFRSHYWGGKNKGWMGGNETRQGYTMCDNCRGAGVTYGIFGGNDDPETKKCYIGICMNGWYYCNECNYNGNGKPGKCNRCNGTGKKR